MAVEPCDPVKAQQIALHTQAVLRDMEATAEVGDVIAAVNNYRIYAKSMAVAPQIREHVKMVGNRRITVLKALAKNGQITSPRRTGQSAGYTDRMLGEGEE